MNWEIFIQNSQKVGDVTFETHTEPAMPQAPHERFGKIPNGFQDLQFVRPKQVNIPCLFGLMINIIITQKLIEMWTEEEDETLRSIVNRGSDMKWSQIAQALFQISDLYKRTGKQCRQRWINYLDPSIRLQDWTPEEQSKLFESQARLGNRWSLIAKELEGRPDNCVKNHFYSALRRGLRKINNYIQVAFRRSQARPISCHFISKILLLSDEGSKTAAKRLCVRQKCAEIKRQLIHYSRQFTITAEEYPRLDRLIGFILDINKTYRNKKKKRTSNKQKVPGTKQVVSPIIKIQEPEKVPREPSKAEEVVLTNNESPVPSIQNIYYVNPAVIYDQAVAYPINFQFFLPPIYSPQF